MKFNDLRPGSLFHFPGIATSIFKKERSECPCCGGAAVASLYYCSDSDQPKIARIAKDKEVVPVPSVRE